MKTEDTVVIFELGHHHEVLEQLILVLSKIARSVICIIDMINQNDFLPVIVNVQYLTLNQYRDPDHINRKQLLDKAHFILFSTYSSNMDLHFYKKYGFKTYILIHGANYFLHPIANPFKPLLKWKSILHILKEIIEGEYSKRRSIARITRLLSTSQFAPDYLKFRHITLTYLPTTFYTPSSDQYPRENKILKIVIPGRIDQESKDVDLLLEALGTVSRKIKQQTHIHLFGKTKDFKKLLPFKEELDRQESKLKVNLHAQYLPHNQYQSILTFCDLILLISKRIIRNKYATEINGITHITGGLNDAIRYAKPILLPDWYPIPGNYAKITESYTNAVDLANKIFAIIDEKKYLLENHLRVEASQEHTESYVINYFKKIFY